MFISSLSVSPSSVSVSVSPDGGEGTEVFLLSPGEWSRLNRSLGYDPEAGLTLTEGQPLDEAVYDLLRNAHLRTAAVRDAANLLSFSDRSRAALIGRLRERGHSPEAAEYAVSFLEKKGFLCDAQAAEEYARNAAETKRHGPLRIRAYLVSHGFSPEDAEAAVRSVPEDEYRAALEWQIRRKYPVLTSNASDLRSRRKAVAGLMRLGFTSEEIRCVLRSLKN